MLRTKLAESKTPTAPCEPVCAATFSRVRISPPVERRARSVVCVHPQTVGGLRTTSARRVKNLRRLPISESLGCRHPTTAPVSRPLRILLCTATHSTARHIPRPPPHSLHRPLDACLRLCFNTLRDIYRTGTESSTSQPPRH